MILFMIQTTQLALSVCFSVKLAKKGQLDRNIYHYIQAENSHSQLKLNISCFGNRDNCNTNNR